MKVNFEEIVSIGSEYNMARANMAGIKGHYFGSNHNDPAYRLYERFEKAEQGYRAIWFVLHLDAARLASIVEKWEAKHDWQRSFPAEDLQRLAEYMMSH